MSASAHDWAVWLDGVMLGAVATGFAAVVTRFVQRRRVVKIPLPLHMHRVDAATMEHLQRAPVTGVPTMYSPRPDGGYDLWPHPELDDSDA